ncbi:hypothetical protein B0J17DRAFT_773478 [Rhizoctonia solani]|nr:hypothetical protein B0J17DRAFT_773478 [Rhizoctonia solani]
MNALNISLYNAHIRLPTLHKPLYPPQLHLTTLHSIAMVPPHFRLRYPARRIHNQQLYIYPIFTTYRNDVPLSTVTGIYEGTHVRELACLGDRHNDHPSPYSESHSDPLERRIHEFPDVEYHSLGGHSPQWYVGVDLCHALNSAYYHALRDYGDALQPDNWNRREPWLYYDFDAALARLGIGPLPRPHTFLQSLYYAPFESLGELQQTVHANNYYALILNAMARVVNAIKMNHGHNLAYASYMRGSPGLTSANWLWFRLQGHPVLNRSEDDESTAEFDELVRDQMESADALEDDFPVPQDVSMEEDDSDRRSENAPLIGEHCPCLGDLGRSPLGFNLVDPVRTLPERPNSLDSIFPDPVTGSSDSSPLGLDCLVDKLEDLAVTQSSSELAGSGAIDSDTEWEWTTEPTLHKAPPMGPPTWPTVPQQTTPPLTWEDFWSTIKGEKVAAEEVPKGSSLIDHIIITHPAASA